MIEQREAVRAVIVHRNQARRCAETVAMLREQGVAVDVVVVDNASSPSELAALAAIRDVRVVHAGANLGFGGGANVGLGEWLDDESGGEWVLVMPHDARPEPGCLLSMLDAVAGRPEVGLVSAEYGTDELPAIDKVFGAVTVPAARGKGFEPAGYAHGTFLMLRRACLRDVGLFDESYFAYCEEADLALRAQGCGWRAGVVWGAVVDNPHQGSPHPVVDYLMVRNTVVLVARHFGWFNASVRFAIAAASMVWNGLGRGRRSPWFDARARGLALFDLVRGRLGPPPMSLMRG